MTELPNIPHWLETMLGQPNATLTEGQQRPFSQSGVRNTNLTSIAGLIHRNHGTEENELSALLSALNSTSDNPLSDEEVRSIARSISGYETPIIARVSEIDISRAFAKKVSTTTKFVTESGWHVFEDGRWVRDVKGLRVQEATKAFVEELYETVAARNRPDEAETKKALKSFLSQSRVKSIQNLTSSDPALRVTAADLDQTPNTINLRNGTLAWNGGKVEFRPHDPAELHTKCANVEFDPAAKCPEFLGALDLALGSDEASFLQRMFGYVATGRADEQIVAFLFGAGANGKSTIVNALADLLGDYSCNVEVTTFLMQRNPGIRNDIARLEGARLALATEFNHGTQIDASLLKKMTGGDTMTARYLHQEYFEFKMRATPVFVTNALPVLNGGDAAIARRVLALEFPNVIPPEYRDGDLPEKLAAERPGILNWVIEGLEQYLRDGRLIVPEIVRLQSRQYMEQSDMIGQFLDDCYDFVPGHQERSMDVYNEYKLWCMQNGVTAHAQPAFNSQLLATKKVQDGRVAKGRIWKGIRRKSSN